jgi:hypothetical protein
VHRGIGQQAAELGQWEHRDVEDDPGGKNVISHHIDMLACLFVLSRMQKWFKVMKSSLSVAKV